MAQMCTGESGTELHVWISDNYPHTGIDAEEPHQLEAYVWREIRLFLSSTFIDTHAERDVLIKRVIPNINRKLASRFIRVTPVDLRWGVLAEESKDCEAIQKTCLNQLERCRQASAESPWFLGLRTDRYGWIQDKLMPSEGFEQPTKCEWLDKFKETDKHVSITSLECVHAALPPETRHSQPTVFFYKRHIANSNEIEEDLRWVFDFEYVPEDAELDPKVQYQYAKSKCAASLNEDKENLDRYLEGLPHVKYSRYECSYEQGGARFTCKNEGRKSFGIGYVSGLDEFEERVEDDLLHAIRANFKEADTSNIPEHVFLDMQHENSIKIKASTFVGRSDIFNECYQHCTSEEVEDNVLIIHGEPGCGKSAVLAAVAKRSLAMRNDGEFVCVHVVDSCPGSNNVETLLKRLQINLRQYRIKLGETGLSEECPKSSADLKSEHVRFVEESASRHPDKKFIIFVDAVNQFRENLQAWRMWWLPSPNAPSNLRVIISTLDVENGTFANACGICPNAVKVPVREMSYEDREEMVTVALKRYNKKLTTTQDPFLGNQMEQLLDKSNSPLYLIAATEALRRFGVFERVTQYIASLPKTVSELFGFLLDEWSEEYGKQFTQDVTGLLCVSRDGLLENEINDILLYKEGNEGTAYDCSFSRFYDSLCSFLASGGGGFLRFFHDQLKFEVKRKFFTPKVEEELHKWLVDFYLNCIAPQLKEFPSDKPPAYYEHCLQQIVYHQLELKETKVDFTSSLRNIYFVKERMKHNQEELLQQEYINAIRKCHVDAERTALKQWSKFSQIYSDYIETFPEWSYNMAINQVPTSYVAVDTNAHPAPETGDGFPLYWSNMAIEDDALASRFASENCGSCVASTPERNMCFIGGDRKGFLYEVDSGVLIHQVNAEGWISSAYMSSKYETFWTGDGAGFLSVWSIDSGTSEWSKQVHSGEILWIGSVGDYIVCGAGKKYGDCIGKIAIVDEEKREVVRSWSTELYCYSYGIHPDGNVILSGHEDVIKCWTTDGDLVKNVTTDAGYVVSISVWPKDDKMAFVLMDEQYNSVVKQINFSTEEEVFTIHGATSDIVLFDNTGERLLCTGERWKTVMVYSVDGQLLNKLKAHSHAIYTMCLIPGTNDLLTAAGDGSMLFNLPKSPEEDVGEESKEGGLIGWCDFLPGGEQFGSLDELGNVQLWDTATCKPQLSAHIEGGRWTSVHPDGNYIIVYTYAEMYWLKTSNLETVTWRRVHDDPGVWIWDVQISPNGLKCVAVTNEHGAFVFDIGDVDAITQRSTYEMEGSYLHACHIHADNAQVAFAGTGGLDIWNMETGEKSTLRSGTILYVRFIPEPDRVIYVDGHGAVHIMTLNGDHVMTLDSKLCNPPIMTLLKNGTLLMTAELKDKTISVHDLNTGEIVYAFVEHRSTLFNCLAVHPSNHIVLAYNQNGIFYILKTTRN